LPKIFFEAARCCIITEALGKSKIQI